jgi:hypothetical protein
MNNILLASVNTLPKLINGKVCVLESDGSFSLYRPSQFTAISDHFDPMKYSILIHPKYSKCIVKATINDQEAYLVHKQIEEMKAQKAFSPSYKIGDRIHLHSKRGTYRIIDMTEDTITITCNKWQYEERPFQVISNRDFCAIAGNRHHY